MCRARVFEEYEEAEEVGEEESTELDSSSSPSPLTSDSSGVAVSRSKAFYVPHGDRVVSRSLFFGVARCNAHGQAGETASDDGCEFRSQLSPHLGSLSARFGRGERAVAY